MMMADKDTNVNYPEWRQKPPDGYPFTHNLIPDALRHARIEPAINEETASRILWEVEAINECGKECLKSKRFRDAFWKFENAIVMCERCELSPRLIARSASNSAFALLKLHEATKNPREKDKLLNLCFMFCDRCIEISKDNEILAKANYRKGEAFRLEGSDLLAAIYHFCECYKLVKDPNALSKAIILAVDNGCSGWLRDNTDFELIDKFTSFMKTLLQQQDITSNHLIFLFKNPKVRDTFRAKVKSFPRDLTLKMLKVCSTNKRLLATVVNLLPYDELQIVDLLGNNGDKDVICCGLLRTDKLKNSQLVMARLSKTSRTQFCLDMLTKSHTQRALKLLKSGEIDPRGVDLSIIIEKMNNPEVLQALLAQGVNPNGLETSPNFKCHPLTTLVTRVTRKNISQDERRNEVQKMKLLVEADAKLEDLNQYHRGSKTSPLHVATSIAILTDDTAFLRSVHSKWKECSSPQDKDDKTPLHIAAAAYASKRPPSIAIWECLIKECKLDLTLKDNKGNTADFYIPKERKQQFQPFASQASALSQTSVTPPVSIRSETLAPTLKTTDGADSDKQPSQKKGLKEQTTIPQRIPSSDDSDHTTVIPEREDHTPTSQETTNITPQTLKKMVEELLNKPDDYFSCTQIPVVSGTQDEGISSQVEKSQTAGSSTTTTSHQAQVVPNDTRKVKKEDPIQQNQQMVLEPLQFDSDHEKTLWEVELYEDVTKVLKTCQVHRRNQIFATIQKLASGYWNLDLQKRIQKTSSSIILYEARINGEDRLLYEIKRRLSEKHTDKIQGLTKKTVHVYTEKIIVWDVVFNHKGVNQRAKRITDMIGRVKEQECGTLTSVSKGMTQGKCRIPQLFVDSDMTEKELEEICLHLKSKPELSKKREEEMGVKMYSLTTQLALAIANSEHDRRDYPIKLTDEEYDIVRPENKPVVVLGRSGTGKTTTCLCRLWMEFKDYWDTNDRIDIPIFPKPHTFRIRDSNDGQDTTTDSEVPQNEASNNASDTTTIESETPLSHTSEDYEHLRQVFITKNYALCAKMKERFYDFVAGHEHATAHLEHEKDKIPKTFSEVSNLGYPLFLTARQFFMMLDKSLGDEEEYFHQRVKIIGSDYDQTGKKTHHQLLENYDSDTDDEEEELTNKPLEKVEVTASYFERSIWSRIAKYCSDDKTDPLLIWMEIQSFIKGSKEALGSEGGILSEEDYVMLGKKRAPNFPLDRREVYKIFRAYKNLINHRDIKRDYFDNCDFIYKLYTRIQAQSVIKVGCTRIHRIYVDEVQDFTHAELSVLVRCCADPNGFFLAGDTAQSIIKGISFRFKDLVSLFTDLKEVKGNKVKVHVPDEIKKLTVNHRSHSGVTEIATSVTDLLQEFFPLSFDWQNVPKDVSNINGPKPLFLCSKSQLEDFLLLHSKSELGLSSVEFGADQAIIVRDTEGEENLPEFLKGIVLKVQECKGLEFNDVLLYNFFTDSQSHTKPKSEIWRASAKYLKEHPELVKDKTFEPRVHPLQFEMAHHKSLNAELKYLYTAITRAKHHIWIYEDSPPDELPMLEYWCRRDVIQVVSGVGDSQVPISYSSSSTQDWKKRGDSLMELGLWRPAKKCYQKAGEPLLEKQVFLQSLLEEMDKSQDRDKDYLKKSRVAVLTFLECDALKHGIEFLTSAARYLRRAEMFELSARLFEKLGRYKEALRIYRRDLRDVQSCVRMKEKMGDYKGAVQYCFSRNQPKAGLNLAKRYITEGLLEQEPELSKTAYTQITKCLHTRDLENVKTWVTFLPGVYQQVHILKQAKLYNEAYQILRQEKLFKEAFRLLSAQGMFMDGIQLAKETEDKDMSNSFLLQQATKEIVHRRPLPADIQEHLQVLSEAQDLNQNIRAKAQLLLALCIRNETGREPACADLCNKAKVLYTSKLRNRVGEIECFHLLRSLQPDKEKRLLSHGKKIVDMLQKMEEVRDFLEKPTVTATSSKLLRNLEEFYGLQKQGNSMYYMPDEQDLWIGKLEECVNKAERVDSDGMLQLNQASVKGAVQKHLRGYVEQWRKDLQHTVTAIQNKFKSFPFHLEIKENGHLQQKKRLFGQTAIQDYLRTCDVSLEVYRSSPQSFKDENPAVPILQLLSPLSQLYMPFTKDTYGMISELKSLILFLNNKAKEILDKGTTDTRLLTCDEWLYTWRVLSSTGSKRVEDISRVISKQKNEVKERLGTERDYKPPFAYSYDNVTKSHEHYFSYWLQSCSLLQRGNKALVAIELSMHYFVHVVARRRSLRRISTENLVNILSVHSSALLAMLSHSFYLQKQLEKTVYLPETFQHFVQTFDLQNCHGEKGCGLLATSFRTANAMKPDRVQQKVFKCLYEILELLLGIYNEHFSTLWYSMNSPDQIKSGEATHCLLLTLTVYANLAICDPFNKSKLQQLHTEIILALKNVNHHNFESAQPLQEACIKLQNCTSTQGLFRDVIFKLLRPLEMSILELKTMNFMGNKQIKFKQCQTYLVPLFPLKRQPIVQDVPRHQDYSSPINPQVVQPQRQRRDASFQGELSARLQHSPSGKVPIPIQNVAVSQPIARDVPGHQDYPSTAQPQRQRREASFQEEISVTKTRNVQNSASISQQEVSIPIQNVAVSQPIAQDVPRHQDYSSPINPHVAQLQRQKRDASFQGELSARLQHSPSGKVPIPIQNVAVSQPIARDVPRHQDYPSTAQPQRQRREASFQEEFSVAETRKVQNSASISQQEVSIPIQNVAVSQPIAQDVPRHQDYSSHINPHVAQLQRQRRDASFQGELSVNSLSVSQGEVSIQTVDISHASHISANLPDSKELLLPRSRPLQHMESCQSDQFPQENIATENSDDPKDHSHLKSTDSHRSHDHDTAVTVKNDCPEDAAELDIANTSEVMTEDHSANHSQSPELQSLMSSHSDDSEEDDDENHKDTDDEDVIEERIALSKLTFEEPEESDQDIATEESRKDLVDKETCIICNLTFPNEAMSMQHSRSEDHITKERQHGVYLRTLTTSYIGHSNNLEKALLECKKLALKNVDFLDAFVKAESVHRECNDAITQIEKSCDWVNGSVRIEILSGKLITAIVELELQMIKQRDSATEDVMKADSGEKVFDEVDVAAESDASEDEFKARDVSPTPKKKTKGRRLKGKKNK